MSRKTTGILVIVIGVLMMAVTLAADVLGLGSRAGIGIKQLGSAAGGLVIALIGVWLLVRKPGTRKPTRKKK